MHTVALILALILGAVGLVALLGIFSYAQWQVRQRLPGQQRREANRLIAVSLLFWVAAALLVNGAGRESRGDPLGPLMLLIAGMLFVALVIAVTLWLRRTLLSLRVRAAGRGHCVVRVPSVDRTAFPDERSSHEQSRGAEPSGACPPVSGGIAADSEGVRAI